MNAVNQNTYSTITCKEDKQKLGDKFLLAFRDHDWDLLKSIITEDCTWSIGGESSFGDELNGQDEVINKAKQFVHKLSLELNHIQYDLNCVALAIYNQAAGGNGNADEHVATVNTVRDGKISEIVTFFQMCPECILILPNVRTEKFHITATYYFGISK